jgi:hypothetical protein
MGKGVRSIGSPGPPAEAEAVVRDRRSVPRDPSRGRLASSPPGTPVRVTIAELVEAVASVTADVAEQAAVVDHILRTRCGGRDAPCACGIG